MTAPISRPMIGTHMYAVNDPARFPGMARSPHPATQAKSLGPRSRAGLIAYPALAPKEIPIAATARPMTSGPIFDNGALFRRSMIATTIRTRNIVPTIWSISGPYILPWK